MTTWLIAGCSSGSRHQLADMVAAPGAPVLATAPVAFGTAARKLARMREELDAWRDFAITTDFDTN